MRVREEPRDEFQIFAHARARGCVKISYDLLRSSFELPLRARDRGINRKIFTPANI